jgi:hypothetical protein
MTFYNTKTRKLAASKRQVCLVLIKRDSIPKEVLTKVSSQEDLVNWERFLLEAVTAMGEDFLLKVLLENKWERMLLKNPQTEEENHEPADIKTTSKPGLYTISAAGEIIQSGLSLRTKYTPLLRLRGSWLKKYGFQIGGKFLVYPSKEQLILRTGRTMDEDLGITRGGSNNG